MLKQYRNQFFLAIQAAGLDVSDFSQDYVETPGEHTLTVTFKPAELKFEALNRRNVHQFVCDYQQYIGPGFAPVGVVDEDFKWGGTVSIEDAIQKFRTWLDGQVSVAIELIKAEQLTPDLWSQANAGFSALHPFGAEHAQEFREEERQQIKLSISGFRLQLREQFRPTDEQMAVVSNQLSYLASAVDRLNRFDWKAVAMSTLISISVTLNLDVERGRQLYSLFQQAFAALMHLLK